MRRLVLWREEGRVTEHEGGGREDGCLLWWRGGQRLVSLSLPPGQ